MIAESRLQDKDAPIVLLNTRWAEDDLSGKLLTEQAEMWRVVKIPAIAEEDCLYQGQRAGYSRKKGSSIWPVRYDLKELRRRQKSRPSWFSAIYQQEPSQIDGEIFKRADWVWYDELLDPADIKMTLLSVDTAFKDKESSDYSVILVAHVSMDNRVWLADCLRGKWRFSELKGRVEQAIEKHRPSYTLIEDKGSGTTLIQELEENEEIANISVIEELNKKYDKRTYADAVAYLVELGKVLLPRDAGWTDQFVSEHAGFPKGPNDDMVDTLTQLLLYCRDYYIFTEMDAFALDAI